MSFVEVFLFASLAGLSAIAGSLIVYFCGEWARKNSVLLLSFAAGVMLTIAFVDLIPEAGNLNSDPWLMVFFGFLILYVLQHIIMFHPCHEECAQRLGLLAVVGLSLHSILDGIIIAIGFEAGRSLGYLTTFAVLMHKIPDGITVTGILMHGKMERAKALALSSAVALCTPLGAILAFHNLRGLPAHYVGMLLALVGGSFIYLAASDLLPETHRLHRRANALFFFMGAGVVMLVGRLLH